MILEKKRFKTIIELFCRRVSECLVLKLDVVME